jgi:Tfp pilus assembly protein PilV
MGKISNNTNNNKGFTLVEVLLLIVVLILVGGLGYLGYKQVNKKSKTSTSSTTAATTTKITTSATTSTPNQNIVKIPELGIQITVPDSIKDLTYKAENMDGVEYASFSTTTVTNLDAACSATNGAIGRLSKTSGQYSSIGTNGESGSLVKQFSTFYILFVSPQSACSMDDNIQSQVTQDLAVLRSSLPSIAQLQ